MIVEENGKLYKIDEDTGLVTEASDADVEAEQDLSDEFRIGDRVEVGGVLGEVISITASVYGGAFGVRFDDGSIDEFVETMLKRSSVEKPNFETPIHEVQARFAKYEEMPGYTNDELTRKEAEARWLNLRAKSLVTDPKLALSDQNELGRIVLVTGTDLLELKEAREQSEETASYLGSFNKYRLANEVQGGGAIMGLHGDASWLEDGLDGLEVAETTDADLAITATELVSQFSEGQLQDDEFMAAARSYQYDYLQMDEAERTHFDSLVESARTARLAELPKIAKQAKTEVEDDLANFDASALYL
jgi:hypothetical protein